MDWYVHNICIMTGNYFRNLLKKYRFKYPLFKNNKELINAIEVLFEKETQVTETEKSEFAECKSWVLNNKEPDQLLAIIDNEKDIYLEKLTFNYLEKSPLYKTRYVYYNKYNSIDDKFKPKFSIFEKWFTNNTEVIDRIKEELKSVIEDNNKKLREEQFVYHKNEVSDMIHSPITLSTLTGLIFENR